MLHKHEATQCCRAIGLSVIFCDNKGDFSSQKIYKNSSCIVKTGSVEDNIPKKWLQ